VLDLDETLVHTNMDCDKNFAHLPDYKVVEDFGYFRPHLREFLQHVFSKFDVFIWTAASKEYADIVLEKMLTKEQSQQVVRVLTSAEIVLHEQVGGYASRYVKRVKPLTRLHRTLERVVMVDDKQESCLLNPDNGILAPAFKNPDLQADDDYLLRLVKLLDELSDKPDVYQTLKYERTKNFKIDDFVQKVDLGSIGLSPDSDVTLQQVLLESTVESDDPQVQKLLFASLPDCINRKFCCPPIRNAILLLHTIDWLGDRTNRRLRHNIPLDRGDVCKYQENVLKGHLNKTCTSTAHCNCCLASKPKQSRILELSNQIALLRFQQMRCEFEIQNESLLRDVCKQISDLLHVILQELMLK
jgi:hypothetical protein